MSKIGRHIIEAENIFFRYAEEEVLQDVSFAVAPGDYVGLVGANGSGKTTLIRVLLGLTLPTGGNVKLFGTPIGIFREWQKIGYIPQNVFRGDMNFPATVEEVVASGCIGMRLFTLRGFNDDNYKKVREALKRADIEHLMKKRVSELSGGERQRVFIARALVSEPELLILDEPTTGIDASAEERFYAFLAELNRSGMTIMLVSHDLEAIAHEVKTVLCLNRRLICFGAPESLRSQEVLNALYGQGKQMIHHGSGHHH
jgi:zinc transport system ATP-binding protein